MLADGVIVEMKVWEVPRGNKYPDGYKYSLYAVYEGYTLVGYDNHYPKGHHRHIGKAQFDYAFIDVETLKNDFKADLELALSKEIKK